jgi:hypothetical protein
MLNDKRRRLKKILKILSRKWKKKIQQDTTKATQGDLTHTGDTMQSAILGI